MDINSHVFSILTDDLTLGDRVTLHVDGRCMAPIILSGDKVAIEVVDRFYSGDIVAYCCPHTKKNFVHRFLGTIKKKGQHKFLIMADNAIVPDTLVNVERVIGKAISIGENPVEIPLFVRIKSVLLYLLWCGKLWLRKT